MIDNSQDDSERHRNFMRLLLEEMADQRMREALNGQPHPPLSEEYFEKLGETIAERASNPFEQPS